MHTDLLSAIEEQVVMVEEIIIPKIIIAGSRTIFDYKYLLEAVQQANIHESRFEVVTGGAKGVDTLAKIYAYNNKLPYKEFRPISRGVEGYDSQPPLIRNGVMADYADGLLAIWDCSSNGTMHMVNEMKKRGKPYCLYTNPAAREII